MRERLRKLGGSSGQSLVEFAVVLPLVLLIVLGVVEVGFALLDQQVVTKLTREGLEPDFARHLAAGCRDRDADASAAVRSTSTTARS